MIGEFLDTWELFRQSHLAAWLIAFLLPLPGVLVVARDQIFAGAALAQASTLGIAVALWLGSSIPRLLELYGSSATAPEWLHGETFPNTLAVGFSVAAALVIGRGAGSRASHEAQTGWVFIVAASLSVLLVAHSPHGLEEVHKLLFSSITVATAGDVWVLGGLAALCFVLVAGLHRRLLLVTMDPSTARALGLSTGRYSLGFSLALGLTIGWSLQVAGLLYAFGCLVLPPLVARQLCRESRHLFVLGPIVGVLAAVPGSVLAHHFDFPPAQLIVAILGGLVIPARAYRSLRESRGR